MRRCTRTAKPLNWISNCLPQLWIARIFSPPSRARSSLAFPSAVITVFPTRNWLRSRRMRMDGPSGIGVARQYTLINLSTRLPRKVLIFLIKGGFSSNVYPFPCLTVISTKLFIIGNANRGLLAFATVCLSTKLFG